MTYVVILPGPDAGMRDLLEELNEAAGGVEGADPRTAVRTGNGGVITTPEVAYRWLAAHLGREVPAPTGTPPAPRTAPTGRPPAASTPAKATKSTPAKAATKSTPAKAAKSAPAKAAKSAPAKATKSTNRGGNR